MSWRKYRVWLVLAVHPTQEDMADSRTLLVDLAREEVVRVRQEAARSETSYHLSFCVHLVDLDITYMP